MPSKPPALRKSEKTRHRILGAAAAAYRERGVDGVGVREIMNRAGLTQGGFYAHFPDKDTLFREASREAFGSTAARFVDVSTDAAPQPQAFIETYLSSRHRDHPEDGCFMATLGGEIARADFPRRYAFAQGASAAITLLAPYMEGKDASERQANALLLVSALAGVLTVSRVLAGTPMSDALLADARRFFSASFARR